MAWTLNDIPDQTGKVIIITGANVGLGYESAKVLANKGAEVVLAVRSVGKGNDAETSILQSVPDAKLHVMSLDLSDLESVKSFAETFKSQFNQLDVLMNNAGVMATPQRQTKDGFELQFGTNHLGHFALTAQLMDVLLRTPNSRVVNVSSLSAENGQIHFDDIMFEKNYQRFGAYGQSKLANLLFTLGLQQRLEATGASTMSIAAHPGVAQTELSRGMMGNLGIIRTAFQWLFGLFVQSSDKGAYSQIRAAVDSNAEGGDYYGPHNRMRGDAVKIPMPPTVHHEDIDKLWELSEALTQVKFDFT